jgi:hypothetical protein
MKKRCCNTHVRSGAKPKYGLIQRLAHSGGFGGGKNPDRIYLTNPCPRENGGHSQTTLADEPDSRKKTVPCCGKKVVNTDPISACPEIFPAPRIPDEPAPLLLMDKFE